MSAHTKGPWKLMGQGGLPWIEGPTGKTVALIALNDEAEENSEVQANGRLMAAAPELLDVARMALKVAQLELGVSDGTAPDFGPHELLNAARAAIAKAEGRV